MDGNTTYYIRARHRGLKTREGDWTDPVAITTQETSGLPTISKMLKFIDNDGRASDLFGSSVSLSGDGQHMMIGSPQYDTNGVNAGHVKAYRLIDGVMTVIGYLYPPGDQGSTSQAGDLFGSAVALNKDGTIALIGSEADAGPTSSSPKVGKVHYYTRSGDTWTYINTIEGPGVLNGYFGASVALNGPGDMALIGATGFNSGAGSSGRVFHYTRIGDEWTETNHIDDPVVFTANGKFGRSVALNGDGTIALIGADANTGYGNIGACYVFKRTGNVWENDTVASGEDYGLHNTTSSTGDYFGSGCDLSEDGSVAVVSARGETTNGLNYGSAVFVFKKDANGRYQEQSKITANDIFDVAYNPGNTGSFGADCSIDSTGKMLLVGMPFYTETLSSRGAALLFLPDKISPTVNVKTETLYHSTSAMEVVKSEKLGFLSRYSGGAINYVEEATPTTYGNPLGLTKRIAITFTGLYTTVTGNPAYGEVAVCVASRPLLDLTGPGDRLVVSNYLQTNTLGTSGKVGVYEWNNYSSASGTARTLKLLHEITHSGDSVAQFGKAMSLSGDGERLVVSSVGGAEPGFNSNDRNGYVYIFDISTSSHTLVQVIRSPDTPAAGETLNFGKTLCMSWDKTYLAIGDDTFNSTDTNFPGTGVGCVYIYKLNNGLYELFLKITNPDPLNAATYNNFGRYVCCNWDMSVLFINHRNLGCMVYERSGNTYVHKRSLSTTNIDSTAGCSKFGGVLFSVGNSGSPSIWV